MTLLQSILELTQAGYTIEFRCVPNGTSIRLSSYGKNPKDIKHTQHIIDDDILLTSKISKEDILLLTIDYLYQSHLWGY